MSWIRFQLHTIDRHREHRVVADAGGQLHVLIRPESIHHGLRQPFFDAIGAQQLAGEFNNLQVFRRNTIGTVVANCLDGRPRNPSLSTDDALNPPDLLSLEVPADDERGERSNP